MVTSVLFVFASANEAEILNNIPGMISAKDGFTFGKCSVSYLITGVGGMPTAWAMKEWLGTNHYPDLAINAGIAGTYSDSIMIGDVVMPVSDCFADMGIESGDRFMTLAEAGIMDPEMFPFKGGFIYAENKFIARLGITLRSVKGITVNTCSGSTETIERLKNKFNPDIETMEGATFFYICAREKIPFLSVRAISNKVEPRNRDSWDIPLALKNLTEKLKEILLMLD
jgi:futalosine hydrolase